MTEGETLDDLLKRARAYWHALPPEEQRRQLDAQQKAWVAAEMAFGDEGTRVVLPQQVPPKEAEPWRPIETVPAGEWVLVFHPEDGTRNPVSIRMLRPFQRGSSSSTVEDRWCDEWSQSRPDFRPTHWMPLPSPPDQKKETGL